MFTSNFARVQQLPAELVPVSIALKAPSWYRGNQELRLAPTRRMLKMPRDLYDRYLDDMLAQLDPGEVYQKLHHNAVLLCWEAPNVWCHRRRIAEWFEKRLDVVVVEYGFARDSILPYQELPAKKAAKKSSAAQQTMW